MEMFYLTTNLRNNSGLLSLLEENQVFSNSQVQTKVKFVKIINEKLSSALTRYDGILYINTLYEQFSNEIICENFNLWFGHLLKEFDFNNQPNLLCFFDIINKFLKTSNDVPDLHKTMLGGAIVKIIEVTMRKYDPPETKAALRCLEFSLKYYNGSCGSHKTKIEKFLYSFVDSNDLELVTYVARCLVFLQQVSGGGVKGINHKTQWENQMENLCLTVNFYMDGLFENVSESYTPNGGLEMIQFPSLKSSKENSLIYLQNLNTRIRNILVFIETMLRQPFSVSKMINVEKIFELLNRGFDINPSYFINKPNLAALKLIIPSFHNHLFLLLDGLIQCVQTNLLPYAVLINTYFLKNLQWMKQRENYDISFYSLKLTIYDVMKSWLTTAKAGCAIEFFSNEILKILLNEVTPPKNEMSLSVHRGPIKHLSKKARLQINREKIAAPIPSSSTKNLEISNVKTENLCRKALEVIQAMLKASGPLISPREHRNLQEFVIETLIDVHKTNLTPIYATSSQCLLELYKTLLYLVLYPNSLEAPPLSYACHVFSLGKRTRNRKISEFCHEGFNQLEKIIHPIAQTLQFPIDSHRRIDESLSPEPEVEPEKSDEETLDFESNNLTFNNSIEQVEESFTNIEKQTIHENPSIDISSDEDEKMSEEFNIFKANKVDKDFQALKEVEMHEKRLKNNRRDQIQIIEDVEINSFETRDNTMDEVEICTNGLSDKNLALKDGKINGAPIKPNDSEDSFDETLYGSFVLAPIKENL